MTPILARADLHDSLVSGDALLLVDGLVDWLALLLNNQLVVKRKSRSTICSFIIQFVEKETLIDIQRKNSFFDLDISPERL